MVKDGTYRITGRAPLDADLTADVVGPVTGTYTGTTLAKPATHGGILRPSTKTYISQQNALHVGGVTKCTRLH